MYQLILSDGSVFKHSFFICHPSVSDDDPRFDTVAQQMKYRHFFGHKAPSKVREVRKDVGVLEVSPFVASDVLESITLMHAIKTDADMKMTEPPSLKFVRSVAKIRGLKPKFIRMRILHELFFYLTYGYEGSGEPLTENEVSDLFKSYCITLSEEDLKNMPAIYVKELSWKMFIPPLPLHLGWPLGWALLCDVFLRTPISVFCKIHSVSVKCSELEDLLNHPIKR